MPPARFEREVTRAKFGNPLLKEQGRIALETPRLRITIERLAGKTETRELVHEGEICRIGSHASNDLVVDDPTISRFHCRITREGNAWRVVDSGSTNGTRIDGVKVLTAELEREAVIAIG